MSRQIVGVDGDLVTMADDYEDTCAYCKWWTVAVYDGEPITDLTCGYCRRFPPYCEIIGEDDGHGQKLMGHPLCYAGDETCGEFASRGY